jgi:hypothetical protein
MVALDELGGAHSVAEVVGLSHSNTVSGYRHRYTYMRRAVLDLGKAVRKAPSCGRSVRSESRSIRELAPKAHALAVTDGRFREYAKTRASPAITFDRLPHGLHRTV